MSHGPKPDTRPAPKPGGEKAAREARLAQALRTNLRRRKAAPAAAAKPESAPGNDGTSSD
jgi:hypothetical protein